MSPTHRSIAFGALLALAPAPVLWLGSAIDRRRSLDAPLLVLAALGLALFALA